MSSSTPTVQVSNTPINPNANTASGTSPFGQVYAATTGQTSLISANGLPVGLNYQPKTVNTTYETRTSPQDVASIVNSAMQQLVGRLATPEEIATYGQELLAAEKANPGLQHSQLNYDQNTAKPFTQTGSMLTQGVDPTSFIQNIIRGTGEAKQYNIAGTYMNALQNMADQFKGSFSG